MATTAVAYHDQRMSVGRVFERAFATIRHNSLATLGLTFLFGAVPVVAVQYFMLWRISSEALIMTVAGLVLPGTFALFLVHWFLSLVVGTIVQGAMTRPVMAQSEGRRASASECLTTVLRSLVPLLILGLVIGLAVVIGSTLLIVPGVVVYLFWSVAGPALVEERDGVLLALSRSQELSEGARWKTFAIILVLGVVSLTVGFLAGFIAASFYGGITAAAQHTVSRVVMSLTSTTLINVVWATVQASLYIELRQWKEGGSVENLEQVFA